MADLPPDRVLLTEVQEGAEAMALLGADEETFRAAVDAFRAQDGESMQKLLARSSLGERCELVCHWLRSKECVLLCLELAGPPRLEEEPDIREFAEVVAKLTADEELVELIATAVQERDADSWATLVKDNGLERFSHLLCHWACTVHYRLVCDVVCRPLVLQRPHLIPELLAAGQAVGRLAADEKTFAAAVDAVRAGACDRLGATLDGAGHGAFCHLICEWFCSLRCMLVCLRLCRVFPIERPESPIGEMLEFARATGSLAAKQGTLERLSAAVLREDVESVQSLVKELEFERYCIQFCHWVCFLRCQLFCVCVCPPRSAAYFIKIGRYQYAEVYPTTGPLPPKIESQVGGTGLTSDTRAFFNTLRLNGGFTLQSGAPQMEYRFETITTDAAGNPSPAAATWQPVLSAATTPTVIGYNRVSGPSGFTFVPVFATLDSQGWIQVPLSSPTYVPTGDLLLLVSQALTNPTHLDQTGVLAGAHSSHPLAQDVYFGIRMRVRNVGDPGSEFDAGTCHHIAIDNALYSHVTHQPSWKNLTDPDPPGDLAVYLLDIQELLGANACKQITDQLTVLFTAAHPNLGSATLTMDGPGGPYTFAVTPDPGSTSVDFFGSATLAKVAAKDLDPCAYLITLTVDVSLTDGDNGPGALIDQRPFCKR
jgi:hypothetical protein